MAFEVIEKAMREGCELVAGRSAVQDNVCIVAVLSENYQRYGQHFTFELAIQDLQTNLQKEVAEYAPLAAPVATYFLCEITQWLLHGGRIECTHALEEDLFNAFYYKPAHLAATKFKISALAGIGCSSSLKDALNGGVHAGNEALNQKSNSSAIGIEL